MAVTIAVPEMSRPTLPLGVSVPSDRVGDPAVRSAIRRYRVWILVGGVVIAFAVCRKPIMATKARQGWYGAVRSLEEWTASFMLVLRFLEEKYAQSNCA